MCLSACYWAQLPLVIYACTAADAAAIGFADLDILSELRRHPSERQIRTMCELRAEGLRVFEEWTSMLERDNRSRLEHRS